MCFQTYFNKPFIYPPHNVSRTCLFIFWLMTADDIRIYAIIQQSASALTKKLIGNSFPPLSAYCRHLLPTNITFQIVFAWILFHNADIQFLLHLVCLFTPSFGIGLSISVGCRDGHALNLGKFLNRRKRIWQKQTFWNTVHKRQINYRNAIESIHIC